jgi:hypothetical protein
MDRNGTLASVATALASNVFPHPGGPSNKAPFGTYRYTIKLMIQKTPTNINTVTVLIRNIIQS